MGLRFKTSGGGGGLSYWEETFEDSIQATSSLTPNNSASNVNAAIVPKGDGAFTTRVPDGTALGGNARGGASVDLQLSRSNADEVASGDGSGIASGSQNKVTGGGTAAFIGGGINNEIRTQTSFIGGGANNEIRGGQSNVISGGENHVIALGDRNAGVGGFAIYKTGSGTDNVFGGYGINSSGDKGSAFGSNVIHQGAHAHARGIQVSTYGTKSYAEGELVTARHDNTDVGGVRVDRFSQSYGAYRGNVINDSTKIDSAAFGGLNLGAIVELTDMELSPFQSIPNSYYHRIHLYYSDMAQVIRFRFLVYCQSSGGAYTKGDSYTWEVDVLFTNIAGTGNIVLSSARNNFGSASLSGVDANFNPSVVSLGGYQTLKCMFSVIDVAASFSVVAHAQQQFTRDLN
jgi:hypothetical protein